MNPTVLVINLGDLIGLALALLLMSALGLYVMAGKASELLEKRKNRQWPATHTNEGDRA